MDLTKEWYRNEFINRERAEAHRVIETELSFYDAIASGDIDVVMENCREKMFVNPEGVGKLSENPVQNIKYHFVVTTAIIVRYCIHSGMEQEKAYSLSDFYILKMDKLDNIKAISDLHDEMCIDICKQMQILRKSHVLSKPIVLCIDYIYSHIHSRITVADLADYLDLSESYLSKLFIKEMGIPISDYILSLKIENAKNLLQFSDYNIIDIANYLSFSSQSHFIQAFKRATGLTPNKFRKNNFRVTWDELTPISKKK